MLAKSGKKLRVYKYAYALAMDIFLKSVKGQYITEDEHKDLVYRCKKTGAMIGRMLNTASSFTISDLN